MQQPAAQPTTPQTATEILDPAAEYLKRRKTALWVTVALLSLSMVVLAIGLISATRTDNVPVAGYYPGITLSFGAFLGIVGIHLLENRRPMLMAAIIFISIGVITSFFCAVVDGIIAAEFIDRRPLLEGSCEFYVSGSGYAYDNYYTEATCRSSNSACKLRVRSNTCYCCYLYNCESPDYHAQYYEFTGVSSCWDVIHLHRLLWASVVLNLLGLFLGIITAAILGAYKDMVSRKLFSGPAPPPHILYNPTQHMLTYAGFCPSGQTLPAYPNYPLPLQVGYQSQPPSQAPTQPPSQGGSQEQGGYMLTPNAPVLYGSSYGPFEKPPPYAC
uniref:Transmembrane protein 255B n=1 Tax=Myripristis murdjan TaxID=586833 RepID=A0A667Z3J4_9TELE